MSNSNTFEKIVNVSREIFRTPTLVESSLEATSTGLVVNTVWSQLDLEKNERTRFQRSLVFDTKEEVNLVYSGRCAPIRNNVWNVKSPDNVYNAVITTSKDGNEDKTYLEIWKRETRVQNVDLKKLDKHGNVYEKNDLIGSLVWSSDSSKLAYLAEARKTTKDKSFFVCDSLNNSKDQKEKNVEPPSLNEYVDDWGEQMVGKSKSVLVIYDVAGNEFNVIDETILPKDFFVAKAAWFQNKGLLISAYYTKPYKLGLIYCPVRKDPRFSPDFEYICWIQNTARMPHFKSGKLAADISFLKVMKWSTKQVETLIDLVKSPKGDEFPGLFAQGLPNNCWSSDGKRIILNTAWRSQSTIISVDVETKKVTRLNTGLPNLTSLQAVSITDDWICGNLQSYTQSSSLVLAKLPSRGKESGIKWSLTDECRKFSDRAETECIKFTPNYPDPRYPELDFEAIFVRSKVLPTRGLIHFPHGGPHSAYTSEFSHHVAIFYSLGYSVLLVNYRGSTGFGEDTIDCLPGHISDYDVKDCQQAVEFIKNKHKFENVLVNGGSHGGFLTLQLIGQYPDYYKAASVRNPVVDLNYWVVSEVLGEYDYDPKKLIDSDFHSKTMEQSPIRHVDKVKTPTLLMIGQVDMRVPPWQSVEYYKALLSRNVPAKLLVYKEDNHPLDKPHTFADTVVHTVLWYEKHIID